MAVCGLLLFIGLLVNTLSIRVVNVDLEPSAHNWNPCSTSGVGCASPYRGIACSPPEASDLSTKLDDVRPILEDFKAALSLGTPANTAAANLASTSREAVKRLQKLQSVVNEALSHEGETLQQHTSRAHVARGPPLGAMDHRKLSELFVAAHAQLEILSKEVAAWHEQLPGLLSTAWNERSQLRDALSKAKKDIYQNVADAVKPWTEQGLLRQIGASWPRYIETPLLHRPLQTVEESLLEVLKTFFSKLQNALTGKVLESPQEMYWKNIKTAEELLKALPLLAGPSGVSALFSQDNGLIAKLGQIQRLWGQALAVGKSKIDGQTAEVLGRFAPFGSPPAGPFRLFEVQPEIHEDFLDRQLPQTFLGLSACLQCRSSNQVSQLALSYMAAESDSQATVCLRARSPCLQDKAVCGCYGSSGNTTTSNKYVFLSREEVENRGLVEPESCSHMIFREEARNPTDIGSSPLVPQATCQKRDATIRNEFAEKHTALGNGNLSLGSPLRICMVSWNAGSERDVAGKGVGWGGVDDGKGELTSNLASILSACPSNDNDIVALTIQEGSEPRVVGDIASIVKNQFGPGWTITHAFAKGNEQVRRDTGYTGYDGIDYIHEIHDSTEFAEGVHMVVLSREPRSVVGAPQSFAVEFKSSSIFGGFVKVVAGALGSTGHKGAAIVRLPFTRAGQQRVICFAGSHLDASSETKRSSQAEKVTTALKTIGCPDGAFWGGDFNPRLQDDQCCPWDRLELLMHHGQKNAMVDLIKGMDPIIRGSSWRTQADEDIAAAAPFAMDHWQCQGRQCSAGWHELPIGFAPTFHKLYHRAARNSTEGTCHFTSHQVPKTTLNDRDGAISQAAMAKALLDVNEGNSARIPTWSPQNLNRRTCPSAVPHSLCWDGEYNTNGCAQNGLCYHTHKNDHCPLFTDRILFATGLTKDGPDFLQVAPSKSPYPMVLGCRYEALPKITTADHTPVLAGFSVIFGESA